MSDSFSPSAPPVGQSANSATEGVSAWFAAHPEQLVIAGHGEAEEAPTQIGPYAVERLLGEGAFARVFLAHDDSGRRFAVKLLRERLDPALARQVRARFFAEQRIANAVGDPRVVRVLEASLPGERPFYLAMEFVDGSPFCDGYRRARAVSGAPETELDWQVLARLGHEVASAMRTAHARGIVHRDLKPDNVLVTRSATGALQVKIVDFGIAKAPARLLSAPEHGPTMTPHHTELGTVMGSLPYMAPEQNGLSHAVTGKADVYALGVMLMITAVGLDVEELESRRESFALSEAFERALLGGPALPIGWQALLRRMVQADPALRPDMTDVAAELQRLAQPDPEFARAVDAWATSGALPSASRLSGFLRQFEHTAQLTDDERAFLTAAPAELLARGRFSGKNSWLVGAFCLVAGAAGAYGYDHARVVRLNAELEAERRSSEQRANELTQRVQAQTAAPSAAQPAATDGRGADTRAPEPRTPVRSAAPCEAPQRSSDAALRNTREALSECSELNKQADVRAETLRSEIDARQREADERGQAEARCQRELEGKSAELSESAARLRLCNESLRGRSPQPSPDGT